MAGSWVTASSTVGDPATQRVYKRLSFYISPSNNPYFKYTGTQRAQPTPTHFLPA